MIKIPCDGCGARCCRNPLVPILLPEEESRFPESSATVITRFREMKTLAKRDDGSCVFLDTESQTCRIYERRPFECRIYPFLLDFEGGPGLVADTAFCPHPETPEHEKNSLLKLIRRRAWQQDWVNAYESMEG